MRNFQISDVAASPFAWIRDFGHEWIQKHSGLSDLFSRLLSRTNLLLSSLGIIIVSLSLIIRVLYRGPYYPGWDAISPAHGLFIVSTHSFWEAFSYVFQSAHRLQ